MDKGIKNNRQTYDLSHFDMSVGAIGCLQTLSCIPVIAGDSISVDLQAVFRLSPLRRNLYLDAIVDLFAIYVPHRHVYGSTDWLAWMKEGVDESTTFGTYTLNATKENHCLGTHIEAGANVAKWILAGYSQIWNRFFKDPTQADMALNFFETDTSDKNLYGQVCCFPKRYWNSTVESEVDASDLNVPIGGGGTTMDLTDFAKQQGRLESERKREWFGQRYADIMREIYGASVSEETEPFPYLIWRTKSYLSGYDRDGSDQATMGSTTGMSKGVCRMRFPSRYFAEHGALWLMALVRFPPLNYWLSHYLTLPAQAEPTYKILSGDPDLWSKEPPATLNDGDCWFKDGNANSLGLTPYGFWYRSHVDNIHPDYVTVDGHPFLNETFSSHATSAYYTTSMYDFMFTSLKLKHWQAQAYVNVQAKRVVPDVKVSIFAGS